MGSEAFERVREQCSMDHWWPRLQQTAVSTPLTIAVDAVTREVSDSSENPDGTLTVLEPAEEQLVDAIHEVNGPPAFLRSDQMSAKHNMSEGSKLHSDGPDDLQEHLWGLYEQHELAWGAPDPSTFYVREWLELHHEFEGWAYDHKRHGTPIAAEVRCFLHEGDLHDYAFYWPKDAITRPSHEDWEIRWERTRDTALSMDNVVRIKNLAGHVVREFDTGYWSVDFALTDGGEWYCIDMARGEFSWHPEGVDQVRSRRDLMEGEANE